MNILSIKKPQNKFQSKNIEHAKMNQVLFRVKERDNNEKLLQKHFIYFLKYYQINYSLPNSKLITKKIKILNSQVFNCNNNQLFNKYKSKT